MKVIAKMCVFHNNFTETKAVNLSSCWWSTGYMKTNMITRKIVTKTSPALCLAPKQTSHQQASSILQISHGTRYSKTKKVCWLSSELQNFTAVFSLFYQDSRPLKPYFQRVQEEDAGIYTCNRSYLYSGQTYNITFVVPLIVKTGKKDSDCLTLYPMISRW